MKLRYKDKSKKVVQRKLKCFTFDNQYFELIDFIEPKSDYLLLTTEAESLDQEINIPEFIDGNPIEVTKDDKYSTFNISSQ
jgi:hypothetical protein